ncbi:MAG: hypothetical protein LBS53_11630 [Synergistaceae bacterium]|jgi:hypothetical protein|nr:hypothetical protein [Synergistaceae bacterium]
MMRKDEKIWVVIEKGDDGALHAVAYDNETDADHYCMEMRERHDGASRVTVLETELNRREENIPFDDTPWGALRMDIKSEFVEGLMEEMASFDRIIPGAAERFLNEKAGTVRKRALLKLDEIVEQETREELTHSHDDWVQSKGMED